MITAITQIEAKPETEKDFEAAVAKAAALAPAKGHHGFELHRSITKPHRYLVSQFELHLQGQGRRVKFVSLGIQRAKALSAKYRTELLV